LFLLAAKNTAGQWLHVLATAGGKTAFRQSITAPLLQDE
jgi:hypothetical protein